MVKKLGLLALLVAAVAGAIFARKSMQGSDGSFPAPVPSPTPDPAPAASQPDIPVQPSADDAGATPDEAFSDQADGPVEPTTPDAPVTETTDVVDPLTDPALSETRPGDEG